MKSDMLRCLVLPFDDKQLIVPYAAVAEVISAEELTPKKGVPEWCLGELAWHDLKVPVIHLQTLVQGKKSKDNPPQKMHVAIFNRIADLPLDFFAMVLTGIPRMHRLKRGDLSAIQKPKHPQFLMEAKLKDQEVLIPDLESIENSISKLKR